MHNALFRLYPKPIVKGANAQDEQHPWARGIIFCWKFLKNYNLENYFPNFPETLQNSDPELLIIAETRFNPEFKDQVLFINKMRDFDETMNYCFKKHQKF